MAGLHSFCAYRLSAEGKVTDQWMGKAASHAAARKKAAAARRNALRRQCYERKKAK